MTEPDPLLDAAVRAALAGGEIVRARFGRGTEARSKGAGDYVTEVDRASEASITGVLQRAAPEVPVFGEEEGGTRGSRYWAVDPLDGTANFLHGFPVVAVSVGLVEDGRPVGGVVHAPFSGQTYSASREGDGWLHASSATPRALAVSTRPPERAVATGFPFRDKRLVPRYLAMFERCFGRFEDLRRPGAAALDLAWVASGVFDGFFELNLSPWDVAAGAALVRAAGGVVTDWEGDPDAWLDSGNILAGSPQVHDALLELASPKA